MPKGLKRKLSIVERRLQSGAIFGASSKPIPLKDPSWVVRFVNADISNDRLYVMQADKGWVYASVDDLDVDPAELGLRALDGRVVRGDKAVEVLMKMPLEDYKAVQAMKDEHNRTQTFGAKATKAAIVSAANTQLGDQGAEFLNRSVHSVDVRDGRELVNLEE